VSHGRVALVGAGPGDPALLTVRALELLRDAEVVAYDLLVSESILALIPADAELLPVGRRVGSGHTGYRLHPDVLARAREGKRVVRLKAGDPLVFGRGAEEAEELVAAGIPFEIVPGITAALGAAAYGAIPLTHRDHAAQVLIATGHGKGGRQEPPAPVPGRTLVLYMGARHLASNLAAMVAAGWAASTPAALVIAATTAEERTITGTLATLADRAGDAMTELPALVIVGDVVTTRAVIDWRAGLPLRGRRIVVACARSGPSRVAFALRTAGAEVLELPDPARFPSRIDLVVLPASSAAEALYADAPAHVRASPAVAIGARTEETARRLGATCVARAAEDSIDALVAAAISALDLDLERRPPVLSDRRSPEVTL
jgi:uroporphyrinogen III methyltransferase/synthase